MSAFERIVERSAPSLARLAGGAERARELAARTTLGVLAEPGDGVMGTLVAALGAVETGRALLAKRDPDDPAVVRSLADRAHASGYEATERQLVQGLQRWRPRIDVVGTVQAVEQAARIGAVPVLPGDDDWPAAVDDLGLHAPLMLWVRGRAAAIRDGETAIALVGARASTAYGEHVVTEAASGLVDRGYAIVSGGAFGIDAAAHRAALRAGGTTVAFLAGGVDRFYPSAHERLLGEIARSGAVVAELPCGAAPTKFRFLTRNRLIAASTAATVVVEAGPRSGSINTASHAGSLGRPLGAVPGPVTSPASAGCHRLLREQNAECVTNADEMAALAGGVRSIEEGGRAAGGAEAARRNGDDARRYDPDGTRVLDALAIRVPRVLEEIAVRAGLEPGQALSVLGRLRTAGRVERTADGWVAVRR